MGKVIDFNKAKKKVKQKERQKIMDRVMSNNGVNYRFFIIFCIVLFCIILILLTIGDIGVA